MRLRRSNQIRYIFQNRSLARVRESQTVRPLSQIWAGGVTRFLVQSVKILISTGFVIVLRWGGAYFKPWTRYKSEKVRM